MPGTIRIIWDRGVLKDGKKEIAGPGDSVITDSVHAEEYVRNGKAHYPPRR